jgi:hypothetical protein
MQWIQPARKVLHKAATTTATGEVVALLGRYATIVVQITGITTGTVTFQGSVDGTNYVNLLARNITTGAIGATAVADGVYIVPVLGMQSFKAPITVATTIVLTATANILPELYTVEQPA